MFTVKGKYTSRGWTEWTQGFQYGSALLQFDATGDERFLEIGRRGTIERMAPHVSHIGVHDHGFNNVSTYGNLLRLMREGKIPLQRRTRRISTSWRSRSAARCRPRAGRSSRTARASSIRFNGPHSLFVDTIRSLRSLAVAHQLGHVLMGEQDAKISLLQRLVEHALNTARYSIYYGEGRDAYDVRGRTAHEASSTPTSGVFRCPNSQQGYSPFSTWTRGLAWAICGFAEQLEFLTLSTLDELAGMRSRRLAASPAPSAGVALAGHCIEAARATADFYLDNSCADGIPMWDTGAPNLHRLRANYLDKPADPFNAWEPVDSSAAAIAAQGLIRLGNYLHARGRREEWRALSPGRPDRRAHAVRRAVSLHRSEASGLAAALGLSSSERLGLHRARPESAERRKLHVGRLPSARTGAAASARSAR